MSTTNTEIIPYKIDDEQFGKLIELPKLYQDARNTVAAAKLASDKFLQPFRAIADLTKVEDLATVEAIMVPLRTLRVKLAATKKKLNDARAPHTDKMRAIVSALVAAENDVEAIFQECKKADDALQLEILSRQNAAKVLADKEIADAQAKTNRLTQIGIAMNTTFGADLAKKVADMHTKFYSFSVSKDLYDWIQKMKLYVPAYDGADVTRSIAGEAAEIEEVRAKFLPVLTTEWIDRLKKERDHLVDLTAGRMEELVKGAPVERVVKVEDFASSVMEAVGNMNADLLDSAVKENLEATFANAAVPVTSSGAKGKVVKKKYKAETQEAFQTIMQSWVRFNMPFLSIDELNKKLSFMRTAADSRLNEGQPVLEAKGLSVIDDISTRTTKTKQDE